ncbi:CcoQ/FixQ family Cbb3-type cytochrome c oxidase assembly chaperone [Vibrio vulnificus]|uniref:cbb3-type cytochrome oxidase subunit 3 n=1 Tax=Vibrio TaxID=662 RepID=UPI00092A42D9|nr:MULTISPECIES: CcoQ/FixQ family Cbb3-type cytochrome c oxidase assembly chaperone [Vibrio]EGQ9832641.1 CcoQ/FixQ family Cbb3-type cytochrome c oxidase assembly chaperone [Vibrio vulnificus]EGQ9882395.1 CcoQ/FixQ family Cbb3-type cytochrome c oxidase assembly chaperone [Vibrio vulnificus]EGR1869839.1 CcoQ/FixQ family Cbb3-type cytochrome c oxidase assembly chaperone [Vibrio vulnificus]EGR7953190.1 CcoQ/FixQ family Cbb3-type cytochrome c oxidase assembly chaperone [Vibrio vulnificus]EHU5197824
MDFGTIHSIYTVVLFVSFIGIVAWAYSKKRKASFDEAANLVFADEEKSGPTKQGVTK